MLRDVGWCWEGCGLDPGIPPSIFGVGEGARYFGLSRAVYMFHPNTDLAMRKLADMAEVVCDISKWVFEQVGEGLGRVAFRPEREDRPETIIAEAAKVGELAARFPNISGAILDDMSGPMGDGYTPEHHMAAYAALKRHRPDLRLWAVAYAHEGQEERWRPYLPGIDVVNLWVWESADLGHLCDYLARTEQVFPGKPINIGLYLRDYSKEAGVPLPALRGQLEAVATLVEQGRIEGFSILAGCLIDFHPEQAELVREFIAQR